jgi:hypothetical protein
LKGDQTAMSKVRLSVVAFFAVLALSALASSTASAATVGWLINGTLLTGTQTAPLATTALVDEEGVLTFGNFTIRCSAMNLNGTSPQIEAPNKGSATSLIFNECEATGENCKLSAGMKGTVGTLPITTEATLDGVLAVQGVFTPKTGKTFATLKFEGKECAETATLPVKGKAAWLAPTGQDERTLQLLSVNVTKTQDELEVGSTPASLKGSILIQLASLLPWSFM